MFSTPGARILKFLISKGGGRRGSDGRMDGEQPNVYGFARHPSCSHPPTAIPYFAVDVADARCCTRVTETRRKLLHYRWPLLLLFRMSNEIDSLVDFNYDEVSISNKFHCGDLKGTRLFFFFFFGSESHATEMDD